MSDLNKNILITPNTGSTTGVPTIQFTGKDNVSTVLTVVDDGSLVFTQGHASANTVIKTAVAKATGSDTVNVFEIIDSASAPLFEVRQNGDTIIGGVLTVNGTGTSTFAGNVSINGNLTVDGEATVVAAMQGANLTLTGNLIVEGDTTLGNTLSDRVSIIGKVDNHIIPVTAGEGITSLYSLGTATTVWGDIFSSHSTIISTGLIADVGAGAVTVFNIVDASNADLFKVMQNGDTIIGGVLTVNGTGTSTFAGNVSINGNLTVDGNASVVAALEGEDLTLTGNLIVEGNTTLGNAATDTIEVVGKVKSSVLPSADVTYTLGDATHRWNNIFSKHIEMKAGGLIGAVGADAVTVFNIVDSANVDLFKVMQNGDTIIGGVLTVNGTGTSTFAGSVSINGNLTVDGEATVVAAMQGADLTLTGNLIVEGDTTLGNAATDTISFVGLVDTSIVPFDTAGTVNLGSITNPFGAIYTNTLIATTSSAVVGDIIPDVDHTYDIGSATYRFDQGYISTINTNEFKLVTDGTIISTDAATTKVFSIRDTTAVTPKQLLTVFQNGNITVNTDKVTIASSSGNTAIAGTLDVTGILTTTTDVVVGGNLTVNGTVTYINTETISLSDNIILLNANLDGSTAPTQDAGIAVNRGSSDNVSLLWDETKDLWSVGAQKFEAAEFVGTFNGDFNSTVLTDLDARYVNIDGDSMTGNLSISGVLSATSKSFIIDHPTKTGYKLRYGSLEGPENGVYVRATVKGTMEFTLPDYWSELVDDSTITVNVTANGKFQPLYVASKSVTKIVVLADGIATEALDFDIIVFAERKDVPKIIVEYQEIA